MTISPRLTRAALTFLIFGTVATLLPSQDMAALAVNGCFTGPAGGTGRFAVAPSASNIQNSYSLTSPATTYSFYFQSPTSSSYSNVGTHLSTTITVTSGKVNINGTAYPVNSSFTTTSGSFMLAKAVIKNSFGNPTGNYESGSVTIVSTYSDTDPQTGSKTIYTANIDASNP